MSDEVREKLKSEILTALWADLKQHLEREALFLVAQDIDLVEAGAEIVADNTSQVAAWIDQGKITRPTPEQIETWDEDATWGFRSLIVAPYVLIQFLGH
ncbi:MAG: DUF2288 family protein [Bdellovibrionota bacterium]